MITKKGLGLVGIIVFGMGTIATFINHDIHIFLWFPMLILSIKLTFFTEEE